MNGLLVPKRFGESQKRPSRHFRQLTMMHDNWRHLATFCWDPFGHSEGQFSLKVKKHEKRLKIGSRSREAPGDKKSESRENEFKSLKKVCLKSVFHSFETFSAPGTGGPGAHFETLFELSRVQAESPL